MGSENKIIYLDTHIVLWLYENRIDLIPSGALILLEENDLLISPIVSLEIQYLFETGKIKASANTIVNDLYARIGLNFCRQDFEKIIAQSLHESWTRDPFDRIIVGQARLGNLPLMTKDESIRKNYKKATWGP